MEKGDANSPTRCQYKQEKDPCKLIHNIVSLLEHQITKNDVHRHVEMIADFIEVSQHGFFLRDLPNVTQLIDILTSRMNEVCDYEKLLEQILHICSIPPILTKSSDVLIFDIDLQELFSELGFLLVCLRSDNLRNSVVFGITNLLKKTMEPKWYSSLEFRKKAADKSRLPEILGQLLAIADDDLYPELLTLITLLIRDSENSRKVLLNEDALNSLLRRIEPSWRLRYPSIPPIKPTADQEVVRYDQTAFIIFELLDYLDKHKKDSTDVKNIDRFSIWNIQYAFNIFVLGCKQLNRNNLMVMKIKLMEHFPTAEYISSGLCEDVVDVIIRYMSYRKFGSNQLSLTSSEDDYVYIKLGLISILMLAELDGGLRIIENARVIHKLLRSIWRTEELRHFSASHICIIQIFCWNVLKKIIPHMCDEFIENSGPSMLMRYIQESNIKEEKLVVLRECLDTTCYILKNDTSSVIADSIIYNDGPVILLDLCEQFLSEPVLTEPMQTCLIFIFCILNYLYQCISPLPDGIVSLALKCFKRILYPNPNEIIFDNRFIICFVDFVWEIIIKSDKLNGIFIKSGGVYLMLEIIQKFSFPVKLITLGALVDLCEEESCVPYLITWSGPKNVKFVSLLMEIFRYENEQLQVDSGKNGQISDGAFPIIGKDQREQTFSDPKTVQSHPAIVDSFLSSRPKIYALLRLLYDRHEEMLKLADEQYKTSYDDLPANDRITLLLAENFLALKLGESWVEVQREFISMNFNPLPLDYGIMSSLVTRYHRWGEYLKETQNGILRKAKAKGLKEEQKLYNKLGQTRVNEALEALEELTYIARCTERMFRMSQKYKQQTQIERSLRKIPAMEFLNKTYLSAVQVTPVFNHQVSIRAEKRAVTPGASDMDISPVSPRNSILPHYESGLPADLLNSEEIETLTC